MHPGFGQLGLGLGLGGRSAAAGGGGGGGGGPDPYYADIAVMLDASVLPDGTGFVDTGPSARTLTAVNDAAISSGKMVCPSGGNDYVSLADNDIWVLNGQFCIEWWDLEFTDFSSEQRIAAQYNRGTGQRGWIIRWYSGELQLIYSLFGTDAASITIGAWSPSVSTPHHVRVSRDASNVIRGHVDGVLLASGPTNSFTSNNSAASMCIGGSDDSYGTTVSLRGSMSAFRFTQGTDRGTTDASFTPDSLPLATSA